MKYSIDTSAILDGWRRHYPPEMFPSVWSRLDEFIDTGQLIATEEVLYELEKKDDNLYAWARERQRLFVPVDKAIQPIVSSILAQHKQLVDTRKNRSGADPFVIALANMHGAAVVTGEAPTENFIDRTFPTCATQWAFAGSGFSSFSTSKVGPSNKR